MLFAIGSRVKLIHTGDEGVITKLLDDNMVNVLLDDGDEIPAFAEDVINIEDEKRRLSNKPVIKAKSVPVKQVKVPKEPELPKVQQQYSILKSIGIQLGFEPQMRLDGTTSNYKVHLINDTSTDVLYTFQLSLNNKVGAVKNGKLNQLSAIEIDELPFDNLNDSPIVEFECWQITTAGTGARLQKTLRIKAKQFFKKLKTAPIVNAPVHHYVLFEKLNPVKKTEEDLKSYTARKAGPMNRRKSNGQPFSRHDVSAFANFNQELDLHIEKLTTKSKGMNNSEKFNLQMNAFESYLNQAIHLGIERVFIIHGLGRGKLKNQIASVLMQHPDVTTFKNEHHPKYGWGATEVIF